MSDILGLIQQSLTPSTLAQLSRQIGATPAATSTAIQSALPALLGGLARNSQSPDGATALLGALGRDHDGGILDDLAGFLGSGQAANVGGGILGHVFGGQQTRVADAVGKSSGLGGAQIAQLLALLAPLVMGALGKLQRTQGLDQGGLADVLGGAFQSSQKQAGGGIGDLLGGLLDQNKDGSVMDDLMKQGGGILGSLLGGGPKRS